LKLYPDNIETKLGFDNVKSKLIENCLSILGESYINRLKPTSDLSSIKKLLRQTEEYIQVIKSGENFSLSNFVDISDALKKSEVPGSFLDLEDLFDIKISLQTILSLLVFFKAHELEYPELFGLTEKVDLNDSLLFELEQKIDEKGALRDNASKELQSIRKQIISSQSKARSTINGILKKSSSNGYCPEGAGLTIRDGRMVIPVLAEHKRHIKGFVHDESATGNTVYLEPAESLEINNQLRELQYSERREIIRILTTLTDMVRDQLNDLNSALSFLGLIDFIQSKAKFAEQYDCICPEISSKQDFDWVNARHPVLEASLKEQQKTITPLNITLASDKRILLISGPNAGGKSVCLKTTGILQYMIQCGLPVSVAEDSKFGVFDNLFLDIGDEQSIENDLSTYSSHLKNMKYFLDHANSKTLFLIDEFGTGTEPQFGGAIAEVILHELNQKQTYGAITTHYGNLKKKADKLNGVVNGAMKYDVKNLEPLYELEIGRPGSSFALEIAGKIGLDKEMLHRAKKLAGVSHVHFDRLINELEGEKDVIKKAQQKLEKKDKRLNDAIADYEELKSFMETEKSRLILEAKQKAERIIKDSNRKVEQTIKEIQESKADKSRIKAARERLSESTPIIKKQEIPILKIDLEPIKIGDKIKLNSTQSIGEVISIKGKNVEISMGQLTSRVKIGELMKISNTEFKNLAGEKVKRISGIDLNSKMISFNAKLDIRGVRTEEAIGKVETFLDEAVLLGYDEIKVLHGKGHGILRDIVRNTLKGNPRVGSVNDEQVEFGGSGITVVELK
jgi:DNA mismatch repair protein MutS2